MRIRKEAESLFELARVDFLLEIVKAGTNICTQGNTLEDLTERCCQEILLTQGALRITQDVSDRRIALTGDLGCE